MITNSLESFLSFSILEIFFRKQIIEAERVFGLIFLLQLDIPFL